MAKQKIKITLSNVRNKGNATRNKPSIKKENNINLATPVAKNNSTETSRVLYANNRRSNNIGQAKRNNDMPIYAKKKVQANTRYCSSRRKTSV